jgi:hypothetical protein
MIWICGVKVNHYGGILPGAVSGRPAVVQLMCITVEKTAAKPQYPGKNDNFGHYSGIEERSGLPAFRFPFRTSEFM